MHARNLVAAFLCHALMDEEPRNFYHALEVGRALGSPVRERHADYRELIRKKFGLRSNPFCRDCGKQAKPSNAATIVRRGTGNSSRCGRGQALGYCSRADDCSIALESALRASRLPACWCQQSIPCLFFYLLSLAGQFVKSVAAAAVSARFSQSSGAVSAPSSDCWALLTDLHFRADGKLVEPYWPYGQASNQFKAVVEGILTHPRKHDGVIIAGDCSDNRNEGRESDYRELQKVLLRLCDNGLPVHIALGNHDLRAPFWNVFDKPAGDFQMTIVPGKRARFNWHILDSQDATLPDAQLAQLTAQLEKNPDIPALIVVHHNPRPYSHQFNAPAIEPEIKGSGWRCVSGLEENSQQRFMAAIRNRRQVKACIFGHTHWWHQDEIDGIHLINLPAVGFTLDKVSDKVWEACGWASVEISDSGMQLTPHWLNGSRGPGPVSLLLRS